MSEATTHRLRVQRRSWNSCGHPIDPINPEATPR